MKNSEKNLICEIHKSHIGGVCGDSKCLQSPFVLCIKCVVDPNCCIRKFNHKLISLKEYFDNSNRFDSQSKNALSFDTNFIYNCFVYNNCKKSNNNVS